MAALPTGTVTLLFTDIEGSTTHWEQQRQAMQGALARHDAILRAAIEAHGGHVFKTVGDAFYAVFTTELDAVDAAIHAQALGFEMAHLEQEHLKVVCLNTKNHVLKHITVYIGSINSSAVRIGEVFKEALKQNAAAIIIAHNHPSGDPTPSSEDIAVTREIVEAGKLLGVDVLDHLVIGQGRWVSLRERGLGFGGNGRR